MKSVSMKYYRIFYKLPGDKKYFTKPVYRFKIKNKAIKYAKKNYKEHKVEIREFKLNIKTVWQT